MGQKAQKGAAVEVSDGFPVFVQGLVDAGYKRPQRGPLRSRLLCASA